MEPRKPLRTLRTPIIPAPEPPGFICHSDNRAYKPFALNEDQGNRILGRVVSREQSETCWERGE